jgi:hypothetical protein
MLMEQYDHFESRVNDAIAEATDAGVPDAFRLSRKGRFEAVAAVNAFFSLLEHVLLIGFMLSDVDVSQGQLAQFIGSGWREKFKSVVGTSDPSAKQAYDTIVRIQDDLRNRAVHGEVGADGTDFEFLLDGVGPVPAHLVVGISKKRTYGWATASPEGVLDAVRSVLNWMSGGPLQSAIRYGEWGLPLFFGSIGGLRSTLAHSATDPDRFQMSFEAISRIMDDAANMDW